LVTFVEQAGNTKFGDPAADFTMYADSRAAQRTPRDRNWRTGYCVVDDFVVVENPGRIGTELPLPGYCNDDVLSVFILSALNL